MKVIVIGLGSMGRRRIRLLKGIDSSVEVMGVDLSAEKREQAQQELGIASCATIAEAMEHFHPSMALVCTSPITHGAIVRECLANSLHVFTEINLLSDWYDEALATAREKSLHLFLSSTFLYRKEIEYLKEQLKGEQVNYIYHIGQYLPDWHPWESYKNFFVSNPKTNGCREIFAIDLPWMVEVFGPVTQTCAQKSKLSKLEIDYADNYHVLLTHANGTKGMLAVDVVARKAGRRLEIYNENIHIFWDGSPNGLSRFDTESKELVSLNLYENAEHREQYASFIIENAYEEELREFISVVQHGSPARYSFEKDKDVLAIIDNIES